MQLWSPLRSIIHLLVHSIRNGVIDQGRDHICALNLHFSFKIGWFGNTINQIIYTFLFIWHSIIVTRWNLI